MTHTLATLLLLYCYVATTTTPPSTTSSSPTWRRPPPPCFSFPTAQPTLYNVQCTLLYYISYTEIQTINTETKWTITNSRAGHQLQLTRTPSCLPPGEGDPQHVPQHQKRRALERLLVFLLVLATFFSLMETSRHCLPTFEALKENVEMW